MIADPSPTPPGRLSPVAAGVLTFLAAGCVLVLEIAAARLLAPYVGVSLTTYTAIIGVILAGIALGAWVGGRAADRFGPEPLIGPAFIAGGIAAIGAVPLVALLGDDGVAGGPAAAVTLAAAGFVAPAAILSAVAPMIVRASIVELRTSGSLVGRLSAIGTIGAISGTFMTGFVLLGLVPTRILIVGTGALLVTVGLAAALRLRAAASGTPGGDVTGTTTLAVAAITALLFGAGALSVPSPCDRESSYYCVDVVADPARADGRTLVLDRLRHAYVDLSDPTHLEFGYIRWFAEAAGGPIGASGGQADVLHIGGGGFTFPRYLAARHPATRHVVLELDPVVLETAIQDLGLRPGGDRTLDVRLGDARQTIGPLPDDGFDLVVGDAFGGLSVPWHLTTAEFLSEVDRVLRPDGRYLMNLIDGPDLAFVRAETATLRQRFTHVAVIASPVTLDARAGGNVVLLASHEPLDTEAIRVRIGLGSGAAMLVSGEPAFDTFIARAPVLTDDFAPVDQLIGR